MRIDIHQNLRAGAFSVRVWLATCVAVTVLCPATARATYSIVATDNATGQIGGAGASCVGAFSVRNIYGVAPGHGAVHAQAQLNTAGREAAVRLLRMDTDPADIIAAITAPAFDPSAA